MKPPATNKKMVEKERVGDDIMPKKCSFVSVLFVLIRFVCGTQPATSRRAVSFFTLLWHCRETKRPEF